MRTDNETPETRPGPPAKTGRAALAEAARDAAALERRVASVADRLDRAAAAGKYADARRLRAEEERLLAEWRGAKVRFERLRVAALLARLPGGDDAPVGATPPGTAAVLFGDIARAHLLGERNDGLADGFRASLLEIDAGLAALEARDGG